MLSGRELVANARGIGFGASGQGLKMANPKVGDPAQFVVYDPKTHRPKLVAYYLYTAWHGNAPHYGFTHDPFLDGAHLALHGCSRLFVVSIPVRIDIAVAAVAACGEEDFRGSTFARRLWRWPRANEGTGWPRSWHQVISQEMRRWNMGGKQRWAITSIDLASIPITPIPQDFLDPIAEILQGRLLTYDEIQSAAQKITKHSPYPLRDILQVLALDGRVHIKAGVTSPFQGYGVCQRCGESQGLEVFDCPLCGRSDCRICPSCRNLGEMRSCRELYEGHMEHGATYRTSQAFPRIKAIFPFELTLAQALAADDLCQYVEAWLDDYLVVGADSHEHGTYAAWEALRVHEARAGVPQGKVLGKTQSPSRGGSRGENQGRTQRETLDKASSIDGSGRGPECLVWAVCGAGKTEIAFKAVELALQKGLRIMFAIPRRDVVRELAERARAAFPGVPVDVLYGGVPAPERIGSLVMATTHQLLRFAHSFDLAILDEADAYPYAGSVMLYHAFQRSVRPGGLKIYMTATPSPAMLAAAQRDAVKLITVPARHHGYPVPVPELVVDRGFQLPDRPLGRDSKVSAFVPNARGIVTLPRVFWHRLKDSLEAGCRVFIFVPRIWLVSILVDVIASEMRGYGLGEGIDLPKAPIWGTYAGDQKGDEKRLALKKHAPAIMVTTSVLERGITVSKADVFVLYAHDGLFDARTLIQMAGRSGRTSAYPEGQVYFMAASSTKDLHWAIGSLEKINKTAASKGLLTSRGQDEPIYG